MAKVRSKLYVDNAVQGAIAKRVMFHWFLLFTLMSLSVVSLEFFLGESHLSLAQHMGVVWGKYAFFFILMLALLPTFIYDTVKLSHRFAGPVMRLKDSLRRLADGEQVPQLKFRENDFWLDISHDFNRVAGRVQPTVQLESNPAD